MEVKALLGVFFLVNTQVVHGFLLDGGNGKGGNITGSNNFLTVQSFLEFKNQQHLEFEQTIVILTSQLNEKLREFGANVGHNDSTVLLNSVLKDNAEIKNNVSSLQQELKHAKSVILELKSQLSNFETRLHVTEESDKIRTQFDMTNITRQVKSVEDKTKNLEQTQIAREQDLVALSKNLNDFKTVTNRQITESENILNGKITFLNSSLSIQEAEMDTVHHKLNGSLAQLSDKVNIMDQKVAFTACANTDQDEHSGYIVKFGNIKTNVGVTDSSSFISSGKFLCEHDGIYMVYVTLDAWNTYIYYFVYVNNSDYVQVIEGDNKVQNQRGDVTVTLNLHRGDTVWVQLNGNMYVNIATSCLTITKIK